VQQCPRVRFSCDYHGIWSSPQHWRTSPRSARVRRKWRGSRSRTRSADSPGPCDDTDGWRTWAGRDRSRDRSVAARSRMTDRKACLASQPCTWACWASWSRCCKCARRRPRTAVGARDLWRTLGNVTMSLLAARNRTRRL
jgi:hypothetical protein